MQARHEYKHEINRADCTILRSRLRAALKRDGNVDENGEYAVRSLYFDTPSDTALREKIDGVNHREKYRIRIYNRDDSFIRLERKAKHHGLCYKEAAPITRAQARSIVEGDIAWMREAGDPLFAGLYARMTGRLLRPKTIVDYIREPFTCAAGNVRITLDRDIRTGLLSRDLFDENLPTVSCADGFALLEVKYDAFIPAHIVDLLQLGNRRASACSKYALSRVYG